MNEIKDTQFAVGDDEEGSQPEQSQSHSEERVWGDGDGDGDDADQERVPDDFDPRYEELDDRHVWKSKDGDDV